MPKLDTADSPAPLPDRCWGEEDEQLVVTTVPAAVAAAAAVTALLRLLKLDSRVRSDWLILANWTRTSLKETAPGGRGAGCGCGGALELLWDESLLEGREVFSAAASRKLSSLIR